MKIFLIATALLSLTSIASANCGFVEPNRFVGISNTGSQCVVEVGTAKRAPAGGSSNSVCLAPVKVDGKTFRVLAAATLGPRFETQNLRGNARTTDGLIYNQERGIAAIVNTSGRIVKTCRL